MKKDQRVRNIMANPAENNVKNESPVQENKMGVMPVGKLLFSMSLPIMISMLVQALYNVVDSMFVARVSENALTALSMAFPIQNLMNVTMDKIRQMVDSNTIVGKPITTDDGTTILPVSKVSFGFASAGTDFDGKNAANKDLFGGGSGAGVNIQPVAFLVVKDGCVRTIQLSDGNNTVDRALTMIPELVEKVSALIKKDEPAAPLESKAE